MHDIRAFVFYDGVSVDQIMQVCHWKAHKMFTNFYLKDLIWSDNDNNMYLGPVVVAQQVLDPSPKTTHPRKENKGGHVRCSQVFRSLIPGSRYWLPPQDVMVSSLLYHNCIYLYNVLSFTQCTISHFYGGKLMRFQALGLYL